MEILLPGSPPYRGLWYYIILREREEIFFWPWRLNGIYRQTQYCNPEYCNLRLAIARVMNPCGATDIIAEMYGDDDDEEAIITQPVYMDGPFVSDEVLLRRLHDRLLT